MSAQTLIPPTSGQAGRPATTGVPSILFPGSDGAGASTTEEPEFFRDLNLDQIVETITEGREPYQLKPLFYTPLTRLDQISFRHEIMRDLENGKLFESLKSFSERMLTMRGHLEAEEKLHYPYQKQRVLLSAAEAYCGAVQTLAQDLHTAGARSRGLLAIHDYLANYVASSGFQELSQKTRTVLEGMAAVRYCVLLEDSNITVRNYDSEPDYSADVEETFDRFKQGAVKDYRFDIPEAAGMNHIEAMILELVAKLNPAAFAALADFHAKHRTFVDQPILDFDRGIQFYIAYVEYAGGLESAGLKFCYPMVSDQSKEVWSRGSFDLALAKKLMASNSPPVSNDFHLNGAERMIVVTGPNQGGKTTFARAFGQLHYLASLGCPVPGTEARVFLVDRIFTHFDSEEDIANLQGKLKDDLVRIHRVFEKATPKSLVVMNEIFASTSLEDAIYLGKNVLDRLAKLDALGVCVTFLDELSSLNEKIVSMVASIVPENPALRTFRIERKAANGLSYAVALAEKYRLTYGRLKERITE